MKKNQNHCIKAVISGSYRKHLNDLFEISAFLRKQKIDVLAPRGNQAINPQAEFIVLKSDVIEHPQLLQESFFAKLRGSTFHVVHNPGGYLGNATLMEIGYSISHGIIILSTEKIEDPNLAPYIQLFCEVFPNWKGASS